MMSLFRLQSQLGGFTPPSPPVEYFRQYESMGVVSC
jgi:hypothetical protein